MKMFFAPTSKTQNVIAPVTGLEAELNTGAGVLLLGGIRYYKKGQNSLAAKVYFQDDLYLHDFSSTAELTYVACPLAVKGGVNKYGIYCHGKLGLTPARIFSDSVSWTIDGQAARPGSMRVPEIKISWWDVAVVYGLEAGYSLGENTFFIACDWENGLNSIGLKMPGTAFNRSTAFVFGYRIGLKKLSWGNK
jgi:hypothetical protein